MIVKQERYIDIFLCIIAWWICNKGNFSRVHGFSYLTLKNIHLFVSCFLALIMNDLWPMSMWAYMNQLYPAEETAKLIHIFLNSTFQYLEVDLSIIASKREVKRTILHRSSQLNVSKPLPPMGIKHQLTPKVKTRETAFGLSIKFCSNQGWARYIVPVPGTAHQLWKAPEKEEHL